MVVDNDQNFNVENEKSYLNALLSLGVSFGAGLFCFLVLSLCSLFLVHFAVCGLNEQECCLFEHDFLRETGIWKALWKAYVNWFFVLSEGIKSGSFNILLLLPIAVPFVSFMIILWFALKSSFSLRWWYVLNNHFAKYSDVCKMNVLNGKLIMLGRFEDKVLGTKEPTSVLCVGETGCGKTSTIAVPSILQADNMSVLAVDNSGTLARHSSGYRAKLGKVFYFNWDVVDNTDKELFYPKFNFLDEQNMPSTAKEKNKYVKFIADYLVKTEEQNEEINYWEWQAVSALETFINFMIIKCKQAEANDYFLNKILENARLSKDDKDVLLSYYLLMPEGYKKEALAFVKQEVLTADNYWPIGSWAGIPDEWQGKTVCLPMLADWLLYCYLSEKETNGDWVKWLNNLLLEATLFNYGENIISGLQQFLYLSKQQRQMVFVKIVRSLKIFINSNVREKTAYSDFKISDFWGRVNSETGAKEPITLYAIANTKTTKFMNRLLVDVLLKYTVLNKSEDQKCKSLLVFDDVGQMLKLKKLQESVAKGPQKGASFLLLCNSFNNMENTYGKEVLESLVANTRYKIIMAENSAKMSRQLDKMAIFASSSVQLPSDRQKVFKSKPYFADTSYYHRLAIKLKGQNNKKLQTKGYQVLLVEGFYHRPVLTKNTTFMKDEMFKRKAALSVAYFLDNDIVKMRNVQDVDIPDVDDVLYEEILGINDELDLEHYMNVVYDDMQKQFSDDSKIETVMINDISAKWKLRKNRYDGNEDNWWLKEGAFEDVGFDGKANPFTLKK